MGSVWTCRTPRPPVRGVGGISLLLIERGAGLATKKIKTAYSGCAGTAYVELEDVQARFREA